MSITQNFFKHVKIQEPPSLRGNSSISKRYRKMIKKCGTCVYSKLTKKVAFQGMDNEYWCTKNNMTVKNTHPICDCYINKHKKSNKETTNGSV